MSDTIDGLPLETPPAYVLPTVHREWICSARRSNIDPPQGCDWPHCGCEPKASEVLVTIDESGWLNPADAEALKAELRRERGIVRRLMREINRLRAKNT